MQSVRWIISLATTAAAVLLSGSSQAHAAGGSKHATIVIDANSGVTLSASAADERRHPASLTKMMTIYLAFEAIEQGRATPQTRIRVSERAASVQPSKLGLEPGSEIALIDAIKALVTKSANDMAVSVAEFLGGTEANFARMMTEKAHALGMRSTVFRNASGLPHDEQVTTARDMVTLGLRLQDDFPKLYPLFAMREFTYRGVSHRTHNRLIGTYEGTDGIKTGFISSSGYNLVANVRRGQKHVIAAVFGGSSGSSRDQTMRQILNMGLFKASTTRTRVPASQQQQQVAALKTTPQPRPAVTPGLEAATAPQPQPAPRPPTIVATQQPAPPAPVAAPGVSVTAPRSAGQVPSTLQAQAALLDNGPAARQAPQPTVRLGGPTQTSAGLRAVQIQVGAHKSKADADRHMAQVVERAGSLVRGLQGLTVQAQSNGATIYRVRFAGLDAARAASTCTELRRIAIDCLVAPSE